MVQSAPTINAGHHRPERHDQRHVHEQGRGHDLALVLRYGALPVQFDRTSRPCRRVSPTLGKDQLRAGIVAGLIGLALVALYMIFVLPAARPRRRGSGSRSPASLFFALVRTCRRISGLTLTLAGVTGIIVSVGVTVDSYVVYFERLKDEVRTGKTVRSSLDTGFRRAFRTIIAADLVSLIGAVVLYCSPSVRCAASRSSSACRRCST